MFLQCIQGRALFPALITIDAIFIMLAVSMHENTKLIFVRKVADPTEPEFLSLITEAAEQHCIYISFCFILCLH